MSSRATLRRKIVLPVTVIRNGGQERQLAHTLDLTSNSARLGGLVSILEAGEVIEVQRGAVRAKFQVVWMGSKDSAMAGQAGIRGLDPNRCIWNVDLPEDETDMTVNTVYLRRPVEPVDTPSESSAERRGHPRYACTGTAAVKSTGAVFAINGEVRDISKGGAYIEVNTPLPVNSNVTLRLHVEGIHLEVAGLVHTSYPLLGMGVSFQNLTPKDAKKLALVVERVKLRSTARQPLTPIPNQPAGNPETLEAKVAQPSTQLQDDAARTLVKLCRNLAGNFNQWKMGCSLAEIEEVKQAMDNLRRKFSPVPGDGFIEYLGPELENNKTV